MKKGWIFIISLALVGFAVLVRLVPHLPNATPITAIAFVAGMYLGGWRAIVLPVVAVLISDFFLGFYDWKIMTSVYLSFVLIGCLIWVSKKHGHVATGAALVSSSLLFFFITNATVWAFSPWYEKTFVGLLYSYELGLPFLKNMFLGDVVYTTSLIMVFEVARASKNAIIQGVPSRVALWVRTLCFCLRNLLN